jgi:hypothetical protein
MSIEITLEADARLRREQVKEILRACGVSNVLEENDNLTAEFPDSCMSLLLRDNVKNLAPLTEGMEEIGWVIGVRLTFRFVIANYDKCELDLRRFLERMAECSDAFFVVAFQYEKVRAIRDSNGLKFME